MGGTRARDSQDHPHHWRFQRHRTGHGLAAGAGRMAGFASVRKEADAAAIKTAAEGRLETVRLDVGDESSIAGAATDVAARLGGRGLDALVNNAGIGKVSPTEYLSLEALREIYEVNLFGQIAVIQAFLPLVRRARGRIINMGSVGDHVAPPFAGALSSSKAAFASMSAALRMEVRPQGVHVCIIEPGAINTPAAGKTLGGVEQAIAAMPPAGINLYGQALRRMVRVFAENEQHGSPPDAVAKVVERALTDRNPRPRYRGRQGRGKAVSPRAVPAGEAARPRALENVRFADRVWSANDLTER